MMPDDKISLLRALSGIEAVAAELGTIDHPSRSNTDYEVPKYLRQSPDGRSVRQAEKRAQKQALKDRRRAFRHSVEKQNKIAKAVDVRNKPQQARMSEIAEESL